MLGATCLTPLNDRWGLYGSLTSRWSLDETDEGYDHGTIVGATIGGQRSGDKLDVFGHFVFEWSEADERNGMDVWHTGGDIIYATAGVRYWLKNNCSVTLENRFRVFDDVNGEQILPSNTIGLSLAFFTTAR